jgi:signal transduction histidine kinase
LLAREFFPAWAVLAVGLVASVGMALWLRKEAREADAARFERRITEKRALFEVAINDYRNFFGKLQDFFITHPAATAEDWQLLLDRINPEFEYEASLDFGFARYIAPGLHPSQPVELAMVPPPQEQLQPPFFEETRLNSLRVLFQWCRIPERSLPYGFNFWTKRQTPEEEDRNREPVAIAYKVSGPVVTERQLLAGPANGPLIYGCFVYLPLYVQGLAHVMKDYSPTNSAEVYAGRMNHFKGVVFGSIDVAALLPPVPEGRHEDVIMEVFADQLPNPDQWLTPSPEGSFALKPARNGAWRTNIVIPVMRKRWTLAFISTPEFDRSSPRFRAWIVGIGGGVVSLSLAGLLLGQIRARLRQESISAELREARDALQAARSEREQLARDLHDGAIQSLYAVQLALPTAETVARDRPEAVQQVVSEARGRIDRVIGELRQYLSIRRVSEEGPPPIGEVLRGVVLSVKPPGDTPVIDLDVATELQHALGMDATLVLAQACREALSNAVRHASAQSINVALRTDDDRAVLSVRDDGAGFDPANPPNEGMGLRNLAARASVLKGTLRIVSEPGVGTRVEIGFPLPHGA